MKGRLIIAAVCACALVSALAAVWKPTERWRGFNLQDGHWRDGWIEYAEDDFAFMKEHGFNFARLPLSYRRWLSDPDDWESIDPEKLAFLDRGIALGRKYGVHIMVNLHRAPGYTVAGGKPEPASLWESAEAERVFLKHWRFIAERYRDVPAECLSFNPVNEPPAISEETYARVMAAATDVIRAVTPDRFVVVDGMGGDRHPCAALFGRTDIGQATRGYLPEEVSWWSPEKGGRPQPLPQWPLDGLAPAGVIAGPAKPHLSAPLTLAVPGPGRFEIRPGRVSARCALVAASGAHVLSRLELAPPRSGDALWRDVTYFPQWKSSQGDYLGTWRFDVPAGWHEVSVSCVSGDWCNLREIAYESADGKKRVTMPFNNRFAPPVNFRQRLKGWAGEAKGFFPVGADGRWSPVRYRDPGKEFLYRSVVRPWEAAMAKGVFAFCGEFGAENRTPHNIHLALLEDYLQLFRERNMGWAVWQIRGETGVMDSNRRDVDYEDWRGHRLDREMLELLMRY